MTKHHQVVFFQSYPFQGDQTHHKKAQVAEFSHSNVYQIPRFAREFLRLFQENR